MGSIIKILYYQLPIPNTIIKYILIKNSKLKKSFKKQTKKCHDFIA